MASIRLVAQDMIDVARDGIGWIALWKDGKGWMAADFWPDDMDDSGTPTWSAYDLERLRSIVALDSGAIIVNGYYHNLGDTTCMTRDSLAAALRWQYDLKRYLIDDHLIEGSEEELCKTTENDENAGEDREQETGKMTKKEEAVKMTYAVYIDREGYIGDVSAPDRETAAAFLAGQGYDLATVELRELIQ